MLIRRTVLTFVAYAIWTAGAALAQTTTSSFTRTLNFLPVGLAGTETIQVNVVNLAANSSSGTAASCTGAITFLGANGTALAGATNFTVTSGQIFSAPMLGSGARKTVSAQISLTVPATAAPPCQLGATLETFDTTTGATHVHINGDNVVVAIGRPRF
jgi:hypothetical protein